MQENRISIKISASDESKMQTALATLQSILDTYVVALTSDERKSLPKMSDGSLSLVQKTLDYAQTDAQFGPAFIEVFFLGLLANHEIDDNEFKHRLQTQKLAATNVLLTIQGMVS